MHDVSLSKEITKYCLSDVALSPHFICIAFCEKTHDRLNSLFELYCSECLPEEGNMYRNICSGNEIGNSFKNFDMLCEIKSKISKKNCMNLKDK